MSKSMELVESCINDCLRGSVFFSEDDARKSKALIDGTLSELRTRLEALERDAARFQHLQNIDPKEAQAFFWTYSSRTERRKAIDAAMEAANVPER